MAALLPTYEEARSQAGVGNDLNILLVSKTGSGKSSLGNSILRLTEGQPGAFFVNRAMFSSRTECARSTQTIDGRRYTVVDTPGTMDTMNPEKALQELARAIALCPTGFHAILLVIRLDCRFTEEDRMAIELVSRIFGADFYKFTILAFSHGDSVENDENKFLASLHKARCKIGFLNTLLNNCGNRVALVDNGPKKQQNIHDEQLSALRTMLDALLRENRCEKFSNQYFQLARETLAQMAEEERLKLQDFETRMRQAGEAERSRLQAQQELQVQELTTRIQLRVEKKIQDKAKEDGNTCFPADATVLTPDGPVRMSELRLGQSVLARAPDGRTVFSPVYTWGHRDPHASPSAWTVVHTASGASLTLSSDHLLPLATDDVSSGVPSVSVAARRLRAGASAVWTLEDGGRCMRHDLVTDVRTLASSAERPQRCGGLFAPFTLCGNLVVDGVLASCYVDCRVPAPLLHALLWPVRSAWRVWPGAVEAVGCPDAKGSDGMPGWVRVAVKRVLPQLQRLVPALEGGVEDAGLVL